MDWSESGPSEVASLPPDFDFLSFLDIAQRSKLDFLPITSHQGLQLLGEGSTTEVNQSIINVENAFAFKQKPCRTSKKDSDLLRALCTEILILRHPPVQEDCNIIDVLGINWQDDAEAGKIWPTLVFPKAEFGSLQKFLSQSKALDIGIDKKLELCSDVINAVQKLHACNIVHGDIKPENVLIFNAAKTGYSAKLADFGWSCFERVPGGKVFVPKSKLWFAPEWHHREVSIEFAKRMDIFSLGMLCLWVILQHIVHKLSEPGHNQQLDPWLGLLQRTSSTFDILADWKDRKALVELATHSLGHLDDVTAQDKSSLLGFFRRSVQDAYAEREPDISRLVDNLGGYGFPALSKPAGCVPILMPEHNTFQLAAAIPQLSLMGYHVRLSIFNALESAVKPSKEAPYAHCRDICAKNYLFQLAFAYRIGLCGMEDDLKLKQYLIDSSSDDKHLDGVLEKLRSGKPPLSYTGAFEELHLNGFIHLIDFTEHFRQSTTDDAFNEACKREAYASERELGTANMVTIMLKQILASAYKSKSQFEAAASLEKENLDSVLNEAASDNPMLPKLLSRLGSTYCELERYEEALELQQRAVKLVSESFEGGDPTALNASAALASAFSKCGKWEDAERLFSELMQRDEVLLGRRHPESIALRANLSIAKKKLGKLEDAETLGREAFALSEETLGPHSPVTWNIATNLSQILMGQGDYEKIGKLLELLRKRQEERKSEDHPEKLRALNVLADSYCHRRMFEEAKQILASTASMQSKLQGKSHPDVIRTQLLLAQCLHDEKSSSEAVSLLNDVLKRYIGDDTTADSKAVSWPFDTTTELASQLKQHGLLAKAGKLEESVIRSRREVVGPAHPSIIVATASLCDTLVKLDDFEKEDEYEASIGEEPLKKLVGDDVVAVKTLANVGSTYIDKDELDRARRVLIKALKAASQLFGADDMVTLSILCNLASAYALKGMADQAFSAYLKAIRAKVRTLGEDNASTQITMANFKYFCNAVGLDWDSVRKLIVPSS